MTKDQATIEMHAALVEALNALQDYVEALEAQGGSMYYGRSVIAQIEAAIAAWESQTND